MTDFSQKTIFKINDIIKVLPHRYPFILIDKLEMIDPGISLVAIKNVTINEPYFQGHFPNQPIMPGVLSLEIMAQAGAFLMLSQVENPLSKNMFFLDLGASPGGWSQVVSNHIKNGKILSVDIIDMLPIQNNNFLRGDFINLETQNNILKFY